MLSIVLSMITKKLEEITSLTKPRFLRIEQITLNFKIWPHQSVNLKFSNNFVQLSFAVSLSFKNIPTVYITNGAQCIRYVGLLELITEWD